MSAMQYTASGGAAKHHRESEYAPGNSPTIKMEDVAPVYAGGTFKLPKEKVWSPGSSWMPPRKSPYVTSQGPERTSSLSFKPPSVGSPIREQSPPASTFSSAVSYITKSMPVEYVRSMFIAKNTSCEQGDAVAQDDGDCLPAKPNLALEAAESVVADTINSPASAVIEKLSAAQDVSSSVDPVAPAKGVPTQKQALATKLEKLASQRQRKMAQPSAPITMENPQMTINTVQVARSTQHSYRITSKGSEFVTEGPTLLETRQEANAVRNKFHSRFNQQVDYPLDPPKIPTMTTLRYSRKCKPPPPILPPKKEITEYRSHSARRLESRTVSPPKMNVEEYRCDSNSNVSNSASPSSPREGRSKKSPVTVKTSMRKIPASSKGVTGSASVTSGKKLPLHFTEATSYQHKTSRTNTGGKNEAAGKKSPMSDLPLVVKSPTMTPLKTITYRPPPTESRFSANSGAAKTAAAVAAGAAAGAAAAAATADATGPATDLEFDDKHNIDDAKVFDYARSRSPSPQVDNLIPSPAYTTSPRSRQSPSPTRQNLPSPVRKQAEETSAVPSPLGDQEQDPDNPNNASDEQQGESNLDSVNVLEQYNGNPADFASAATMLGEIP